MRLLIKTLLFLLLLTQSAYAQTATYSDPFLTSGDLLNATSGTPTCGTGCSSITSGASNLRGSVTTGSGVTSITVNFSTTLAYTPFCTCSIGNGVGCGPASGAVTTAHATFTAASSVTSQILTYICGR